MKYIGLIRSGTPENNQIEVQGTIERVLPGSSGDIYLSGTIINQTTGSNANCKVGFYRTNREAQFDILKPNESLELKNVPCSRLILVGPESPDQALIEYLFTQIDTEADEEDLMMLVYTTIEKKKQVSTTH